MSTDLALGVALARPERRTICINGDGSMLMCLGTLATAVEVAARNFVLIVADNGVYEITGHQRVPAAGRVTVRILLRFPSRGALGARRDHLVPQDGEERSAQDQAGWVHEIGVGGIHCQNQVRRRRLHTLVRWH